MKYKQGKNPNSHVMTENKLKALERGRKNYTKERYKKIVNTRKKNGSYVPWTKGLTKETDERIKKASKKISNTLMGHKGYFAGKKRPDMSIKMKGHKVSEETKQKIAKSKLGNKSHFWKGGISYNPYPVDWTKTLKKSIKERDKYLCQICLNEGILVHHIDYNKNNCNPDNLITLCRSCHSKTNIKRNFWIEYFKNKEKFLWQK